MSVFRWLLRSLTILAAILAVAATVAEIGHHYLTGEPLADPGHLRGWIAYGLAMAWMGERAARAVGDPR